MAFTRALLSAFAVTIVLNLVLGRNNKNPQSSDIYHFTARYKHQAIYLGCAGIGIVAVIELGAYFSHQEMPLLVTVLLALLLALPCLILCIMAIPGMWELTVDDDDVTIRKLFGIRKHWKISEIERCAGAAGELRVYVKGRKRTAFLVDAMFDNYNNFVFRMNKEMIPIT